MHMDVHSSLSYTQHRDPNMEALHQVPDSPPASRNLSTQQCLGMVKRLFKNANDEEISQTLQESSSKDSPIMTLFIMRVVENPNTPITHPKLRLILPPIFSLLCTMPFSKLYEEAIKDPRIDIFYQLEDKRNISLLHSAILQSKIDVVNCIFASKKFSLSLINTPYFVVNHEGRLGKSETVLSLSTRKFQPDLMKQLMAHGAKVDQENADGGDCLTQAVKLGASSETLKFLFSQQSTTLLNKKQYSHSLLHLLVKNPVMSCEEMIGSINILKESGSASDLEILNDGKHTSLYELAQQLVKRPELSPVAAHLLELGADVLGLEEMVEEDKNKKQGSEEEGEERGEASSHAPYPIQSVIQAYASKIHALCETTHLIPQLNGIVEKYLIGSISIA